MKLQSFYLLTVFFMGLFVLKSQAYTATISENLSAFCRVWIEDSNHFRIAGDGKGHYRGCGSVNFNHIDFNDQQYYIVVKVEGSTKEEKVRGPFDSNHSCSLYGEVDSWGFDC
ncbi:uncharacterized protein OCT59_003513 [Rhizophagus irregularis]|uniref:Secreted protein n=3 Tax=Rhizophagus irregularis TaxID=588596 RepID=U9TK36_RHIID|nr:hypothetical protein GLOIN_2v1483594 [Rhizophagus irregularis DAOM 181602=DAOM 197198]PKK68048.1 hypothetical protein RhiirC2_713664 [Rhizophagus irregularis]POG64827.1 hypothetical protein GLOIN_2v1483594 [Rhizophagus irregularis DAOM 181602=DAOM 197198]UZO11961.1 hypothetical protein OCT59_003513 [Rhizophagus irregularis]CAB4383694.1 unnamed protein product [Rhizophagus irregularis]CAB5353304.1 unnamed protein product [Rhizophagus irregularis]|eukprot:XP_025171693.1 hypothetical protein GLOIN_2v1483594 [Rhizophagus irregularis DAOM 181602=DAOM 197198]